MVQNGPRKHGRIKKLKTPVNSQEEATAKILDADGFRASIDIKISRKVMRRGLYGTRLHGRAAASKLSTLPRSRECPVEHFLKAHHRLWLSGQGNQLDEPVLPKGKKTAPCHL